MKSLLIVLFTSGLLVGCSVPDSVNFIPIPSFKGAKKSAVGTAESMKKSGDAIAKGTKKSADGTAEAMKKSGEAIADTQPTTSQTKNVSKDYTEISKQSAAKELLYGRSE